MSILVERFILQEKQHMNSIDKYLKNLQENLETSSNAEIENLMSQIVENPEKYKHLTNISLDGLSKKEFKRYWKITNNYKSKNVKTINKKIIDDKGKITGTFSYDKYIEEGKTIFSDFSMVSFTKGNNLTLVKDLIPEVQSLFDDENADIVKWDMFDTNDVGDSYSAICYFFGGQRSKGEVIGIPIFHYEITKKDYKKRKPFIDSLNERQLIFEILKIKRTIKNSGNGT